jgi:hypothetical protein
MRLDEILCTEHEVCVCARSALPACSITPIECIRAAGQGMYQYYVVAQYNINAERCGAESERVTEKLMYAPLASKQMHMRRDPLTTAST